MKAIACAATLVLGGCAAHGPSTTAIPLAAVQGEQASVVAAPGEVREVDLQALPKDEPRTVCRKEAPTGSRIAVMRCDPPRTAAQQELDQFMLEKDLEQMRSQMMYEEQMRQQREAAMRERMMSGR